MGKENQRDVEALRAADTDRQKVVDQLKFALDEGRLSLHEYDDRVGLVYASKTYKDLLLLVADLPKPGVSAADVRARRQTEQRRADRRMPVALMVLWTIWASITVVNLVVFGLVDIGAGGGIYPWPVWLLVPGAALGAVTVGVQAIRRQQRSR
jgi:Domain of unknown function (DUF1707)